MNSPRMIQTSFSHTSHFLDDDTKRRAEVCSLETFLLQDMDVNDKVIIIADTRHTRGGLNVRSIPRCAKEI